MNRPPDPAEPDPDPDPEAGISVDVSDTQSHLKVDPEAVARVVRRTLRAEGVAHAFISVAVVDDATIRVVNRKHLDHDWPTDVISFGLSEPDEVALSGELVVSAETAVSAAGREGVRPTEELALYLVHGLLHLCGYDDSTAALRETMRSRESEVMALLGQSNTDPVGAVGASVGGRESARWTV